MDWGLACQASWPVMGVEGLEELERNLRLCVITLGCVRQQVEIRSIGLTLKSISSPGEAT